MVIKYNLSFFLSLVISRVFVQSRPNPLLLYRPKDITDDCVWSHKLRYDISFGMGMSDTITLLLRTVENTDYECEIDVNSDSNQIVYTVIRFPNKVGYNCAHNERAFHVIAKNECWPVCDLLDDIDSSSRNWLFIRNGRFRFQFRSNASINTDMEAYLYEVTVTTARLIEKGQRCMSMNETECYSQRKNKSYCMTSGIVCDGINNCGVEDWFDERKSECENIRGPKHLSYVSIAAISGLLFCVLIAFIHGMRRCLPKSTSFFIFNVDGDNSLRLDPILTPGVATGFTYADSHSRKSIIPTEWSESSDEELYDEPSVDDIQRGSVGDPSQKYYLLRTVENTDYECEIDVNSDSNQIVYTVIRFPNKVGYNCAHNERAFHVIAKNECWPVCDLLDDIDSSSRNWLFIRNGRFRFQFRSNASINTDMEAYLYEVTVTTARLIEKGQRCMSMNETECYSQRKNKSYCMTSGIVCDGINNCGVEDWFDERKSECENIRGPEHLSYVSIAAISGLLFCVLIAFIHGMRRCLPKSTSFFIFNVDGDNSLRLDPILTPGVATGFTYADSHSRKSIIPTEWSESSDEELYDEPSVDDIQRGSVRDPSQKYYSDDVDPKKKPPSRIRVMSQRFSRRLRSMVDHFVPERPSAFDFIPSPPKLN